MTQDAANPSPTTGDQLSCRPETAADEEFLFAVYASTREDELALTGWPAQTRLAFLNMQFKAMRIGYASQFPQGEFSIICLGSQPVGRMVVDRGPGVIRLADIALLTPYRGRGIGSKLIRRLLDEAAAARKPLRLHVFRGTPAVRLYARLGFVKLEENGPNDHLEWRPPDSLDRAAVVQPN